MAGGGWEARRQDRRSSRVGSRPSAPQTSDLVIFPKSPDVFFLLGWLAGSWEEHPEAVARIHKDEKARVGRHVSARAETCKSGEIQHVLAALCAECTRAAIREPSGWWPRDVGGCEAGKKRQGSDDGGRLRGAISAYVTPLGQPGKESGADAPREPTLHRTAPSRPCAANHSSPLLPLVFYGLFSSIPS